MQRLNSRIYNLERLPFLSIFRTLLVSYGLYFFVWRLDWSFYEVARSLYRPVGLGTWLLPLWPGLEIIQILQFCLVAFGLVSLFGQWARWTLPLFTLCIFTLDALHNSFGFINAQIHYVFFLVGANCLQFSERLELKGSTAFRFCEVVFVMVYLQSGISKLIESGWEWGFSGGTLQIGLLRQGEFLGYWLAQYPRLCILLATSTLVFELLFPALYFYRRTQHSMLIASIAFHLGTYLLMGIGFFHLWVFPAGILITKYWELSNYKSHRLNFNRVSA